MKSKKKILFAVMGVFFLVSACQDDQKKGNYSGVSDMIAERNKARFDNAENPPKKRVVSKKRTTSKSSTSKSTSSSKKEELLSIILYEEDVAIVGSDSGRTLAKGVAYINKKGQIVRIKILKE